MDSISLFFKTCQNCDKKFLAELSVCKCGDYRNNDKKVKSGKKKCSSPNCEHIPSFNVEGSKKAIKCARHKEVGMINVTSRKCASSGCGKQPTFNIRGEKCGKFCSKHKYPTMINVKDKTCSHRGCLKVPQFNSEGKKKGKFCSAHKLPGMINVFRKKCPSCDKTPHYNFKGETRGKFCGNHKEKGMIIVTNKTCENPDCGKQPGFNFKGETIGRFCARHKLENMVNVKNKICEYPGCELRAHCNNEGESRAKFCSNHKQPGMSNVSHKKCRSPGCKTRPSFNIEGQKAKFCEEHKLPNMVNVKDKKCENPDCGKLPQFNFRGQTHAKFCSKHKEKGMINVKSRLCPCGTRAYYGIPGQQPSVCAKHKSEGMCRTPSARCKTKDCKEQALYGIYNPVHCEEHHEKDEVNMCLRKCKSCSSLEILNEEGFCFEYCINSDLYKRHKHHKEIRIQKFLKSEIKEEPYLCDKIIDSSCNRKRPDILYDCHTHFVAVEVDENQHSSYNKSCELSRMKEICQAIGMPTIFIRYNPDKYKGSKLTKAKREQILVEWVQFCMKPLTSKDQFLQTVYLFYDGFNTSSTKLEEIPIL